MAATIEWQYEKKIPEEIISKPSKLCKDASPKWFVDEINEDIDNLANIIKKFGAKVFRPKVYDISKIYSSPFWSSSSNNIYNVRDLHLVVGNYVIESPSHNIRRYY